MGRDGLTPAARTFFGVGVPGLIPVTKAKRKEETHG